MIKPRPFHGWAVYDPSGLMIEHTVGKYRGDAIRKFIVLPEKWKSVCAAKGYTCRRVVVTPAEGGGE